MHRTLASILLISSAFAAPTTPDYTPPGGWDSVKYPQLHEYPAPAGGYPAPPGGYPAPPGGYPAPAGPGACTNGPFKFTSTYHVMATPDQVVNGTTPTGGLAGASGTYDLGINSDMNIICYNIVLKNFRGDYSSPARTATHIHQAARGQSGPPRIAFPNPVGNDHERVSVGCLQGPFVTGVMMNGQDTGNGFTVKQIEENPSAFFADVHSSLAVPGAVRGQLA